MDQLPLLPDLPSFISHIMCIWQYGAYWTCRSTHEQASQPARTGSAAHRAQFCTSPHILKDALSSSDAAVVLTEYIAREGAWP